MVVEQLNGFLLHRRAYRETSYLTDFFTLELGKIRAVVRGVRGSKGDKKSLLQSFQPLALTISGKHELRNLNQLESTGAMLRLEGDRLFSAMYINELTNRLLPIEVPHPELYDFYQDCLTQLQSDVPIEPCLRHFELNLLADLGYGIDFLHECDTGRPIDGMADYCLVLEQGFKKTLPSDKVNNCFAGDALLQVGEYNWTAASLQCAKRVTRMAFAPLLGYKPLKSRELFQPRSPADFSK